MRKKQMLKKILNYSRKLGGVFQLLKVYYYLLCYKMNKRPNGKIVRIFLSDLDCNIYIRKYSSDIAILWAIYLAEEYNIMWKEGYTPKLILDAGANIGLFSIVMARRFPNARIIAVEPDEDNYSILLRNIEHFEGISSVRAGLWNKDVNLRVSSNNSSMGITVEESSSGDIRGLSVVEMMRIYNINKIDVFKIDIEGSEKELFSENYESWVNLPDCYIIETHEYLKKGIIEVIENRLINELSYNQIFNSEDTIYYKNNVLDEVYYSNCVERIKV